MGKETCIGWSNPIPAKRTGPVAETPTLYTPLGVTVEDPDAIPEWKQPTGAHDAYNKGDQVRYQGKVYESTMDANTWAPDAFPAGWAEVS